MVASDYLLHILLLAFISTTCGVRYSCENAPEEDLYCFVSSVTAETHSCRTEFPEQTSIQLQFAHLEELSARMMYRMPNVERLDIFNSYVRNAFLKPELKYFRVSRCQLNEIQIDTAEKYQLTELHLPENELTSIPKGLNHLTNLTLIDLSNNHLSYLDMKQFNGLDQLTILGLSYNSIKVVFATGLVQLPSLLFLNLAHNNINTMDISRWNFSSLQELDVSTNSLERIDNLLEQLPSLGNINFGGNQWNCAWRDDFLEKAEGSLQMIGLVMCQLTVDIHGLAQKARQEQSVKKALAENISNVVKNLTTNEMDLGDIVEDVFCRIIQGE
ncbi:leucine-rich repeat-containing protein 15 [Aedes aegypti]|uniref:Uncharacterized protein n=1 Tax=Aedes aegypti TaxID=7159 RepID=A0A1S4EWH0_AEDAE|nr:leucine-rich repeat-containing protein 15 [Aedes aegypti]